MKHPTVNDVAATAKKLREVGNSTSPGKFCGWDELTDDERVAWFAVARHVLKTYQPIRRRGKSIPPGPRKGELK